MKRSAKKKTALHAVPNVNNAEAPLLMPAGADPRETEPSFDWHFCKVEKTDAVINGIVIPESLRTQELVILKSGPGRRAENGEMYPMMHGPGDRIIMDGANPARWIGNVDGVDVIGCRDCEIAGKVLPRAERTLVSLS
jgi:hypothetical protein